LVEGVPKERFAVSAKGGLTLWSILLSVAMKYLLKKKKRQARF
jgi:hypothetical protein